MRTYQFDCIADAEKFVEDEKKIGRGAVLYPHPDGSVIVATWERQL